MFWCLCCFDVYSFAFTIKLEVGGQRSWRRWYNSIPFNSFQFNHQSLFSSLHFTSVQFSSVQFNSVQFNHQSLSSSSFQSVWNDNDDNDWRLNWTELNWTELNWIEVKWSELNNDWWLNWTESKKSNDLLECVQPRQIASRSSIDWIGLETESEWNYIVRSCIIRNTTQNQGSSIISCIEVQLAMAQYDCHPPGVLKCSYQCGNTIPICFSSCSSSHVLKCS